MMCFRDRTFCDKYKDCKDGVKCQRALTPKVQKAADHWWGKDGAPICLFVDDPNCMVKK